MEGFNNNELQKSKFELAEKAIFDYFENLQNIARARVMSNQNYNSLSERIDF